MSIVIASGCTGCDKIIIGNEDTGKKYELICKHPLGHIERYPVSFGTFWSPHANAAGIFRFKTTDGRIVRSSFCHGETFH